MNERDAFVSAILVSPGDATCRLAFADWLDERSDPRAGCVRLAARLRASYGPRHPDHALDFWEALGRGIEPGWWANEAIRLGREVQDRAGDGCKAAVLIALALSEASLLFPGGDATERAAALRREAATVADAISRQSVPLTSAADLRRCLRTAALGDEDVAESLFSAFAQAGADGVITITPDDGTQLPDRTRVSSQQGLRFPVGDRSHEGRELRPAAVLVSLRGLGVDEIRRALAASHKARAGLLCCCAGLDAEGAELLARAGTALLVTAEPIGRVRDCFEDIAVVTGGRLIGPDDGPVRFTKTTLGRAGSVGVSGGQLAIDDPAVPRGNVNWAAQVRRQLDDGPVGEQEWHALRLAQVRGGVVTVSVCGPSPEETEQLHEISCGALHSGRAAIAEGGVPGGGVAYLRAGTVCGDGPIGLAARWALAEPARAIVSGTALDAPGTLPAMRADDNLGIDAALQELVPWQTEGPLDPARVARMVVECAFESAARAVDAGWVDQVWS